jgi:hypothetical protein
MKTPISVGGLEKLGRVRLSPNFFFRDFLYSEISQIYGLPNIPDDPDLAIEAGTKLCQELLEPLQEKFGRLAIRSGYRSCEVNHLGNEKGHNCSSNEANYAGHIWDRRDANGHLGATACVVVTAFVDHFWPGGSMTTCPMVILSSIPSWQPSILRGTSHPPGRFTATRSRAVG